MGNNKGKNNGNWKGGVSEYPNHYLMKQNRRIVLRSHPLCEICGIKKSVEIHHKDKNKSNHSFDNLVAVCKKCHFKEFHSIHKQGTKTGFLGLVIEGELKEKLVYLAKKERRTQTVIVEQALRNYFKSKKLLDIPQKVC